MTVVDLSPPTPIGHGHDLSDFESGEPSLDEWLKKRALKNHASGASRCFVLCAGVSVVGYYSLAASSVLAGATTGRVRRNMPNPVPVVLIGRLAIDRTWQGKGLGADLLRDAVLRVVAAGDTIGIRAILVHAISPEAKTFHEKQGFRASPVEPMTLMITTADARRMLTTNR